MTLHWFLVLIVVVPLMVVAFIAWSRDMDAAINARWRAVGLCRCGRKLDTEYRCSEHGVAR